MKHILVTGMLAHANGIATSMLNLYRHMDRERIQMDFLLRSAYKDLDAENNHRTEIERLGGRVFFAEYDEKSFPESGRRNIRRIIDNHPDIVGIHMCAVYLDDIYPIQLAVKRDLPVRVLHCHTGIPRGRIIKRAESNETAENIISGNLCDRWACSDLSGQYFYGDRSFYVLPNAVDTKRFDWNPVYRSSVRKGLGITEQTRVLGYLGGIYANKNPKYILQIFRCFKDIHPDSVLLMVGAGNVATETMEYAERLNLTASVIFTGEQKYPELFYQAMDCLLMPSYREGMPNVAIEAQVSGLPCLFSDTITEMVRLTPQIRFMSIAEAPSVWAEEAERLINVSKRRSFAGEIRKHGFDIRDTARLLTDYYCEKIEERGRDDGR